MTRPMNAILALAVALVLPAVPASAQSNSIEIRVCNHTNRRALVAASYIPRGDTRWRNRGWLGVGANDCITVDRTTNRNFYLYAEVQGNSNSTWGGSHNLCVEYPGPYNYFTSGRGQTCRGNRRAVGFRAISADPGTFTWRLRY